jgi:hypothetical protein
MATIPHEPAPADVATAAVPPSTTAGRTPRRGAPLPVAATVAALWAAAVSLGSILVLAVVGAAGSGAGIGAVARIAAAGWLLGHGAAVQTPTDRVTLVPLAITALAAWRLARAGIHTSRAVGGHRERSIQRAAVAGLAVGLPYGGIAAATAWLAHTTDLAVSPGRTGITVGLFAAAMAALGALWHSRAGRSLAGRMAPVPRDAIRTGLVAAAILLAAGAGAAGLSLALAGGEAAGMLGGYHAGLLGQAGITVLCFAYLPNVAVWGAAYLLGPGFSLGVDTVVSPGEVLVGPVPALPILAGLPAGPLTGVGPALLVIPLAAGVCAGWLLTRRRDLGWSGMLVAAALAGPVAGILVQGAGYASAGALGSGRLADVGSVSWRVGLFAALMVSAGAVLAAAATRALARPPVPARRPG